MYAGCEEIAPGIYRGSIPSKDHLGLYFGAVVYCTNADFDTLTGNTRSSTTLSFHLDDIIDNPDRVVACVNYVVDVIAKGDRAVAVCSSGINRSGIFCLLVLLKLGYTLEDGLDLFDHQYMGRPYGNVQNMIKPILPFLGLTSEPT